MVNKQRSKYLLERLQERFSDISDKYEGLDGQEYVRKILGDYQDSPRVKISELPTDLYEKIKGKGQITGESSSVGSVPQNYSGGVLPNIGIP
jgi:hypothetical protein